MINHLIDHIQIAPFEVSYRLVNFALSIKLDERLSLPRSGCRVGKDFEQQRVITSGSVVQLPEHFPKNGSIGFLEYDVPETAVAFKVLHVAVTASHLLG